MNDNTFDALANEHRRELLLRLLTHSPQTVAEPLPTGGVAKAENSASQFEIVVYHNHLPKLENYGYIERGKDTHEVVRGPQFEEIRPLLEWMDDQAEIPDQNDQSKTMKPSGTDTEFLTTAVERGYFKVPRQTSLVALADAHGISDVEASERLRSEIDTVLREHLSGVDATIDTDQY